MTILNINKPIDANGNPYDPSRFPSLSYTTPLGANATYTQPWIDSIQTGFTFPDGLTVFRSGTAGPQDVNFVSGSVYTDQAGTLYIDQSDDKVNVQSVSIAVSAATLTQIPLQQLTSRYYRFRYDNGATAQGTFVLSQISERIDAFNQMSLTGRKAKVISATYDQVLNTAASGITTITITPPVGELWRIKVLAISAPAPAGAASGTHLFEIRSGVASSSYNAVMSAKSNFGDPATILDNYITSGTSSKIPTTEQAQQQAILNLVATNDSPLSIVYSNATNVTQTGTAIIRMVREVEYVV
ncbi:hypothetical protein SD70_27185 [Gordoniibacillus kamchatkensis]|uniref:Uncharacterized protein n=1 Tax=Gordoniibacillus kamchatkensis TaxID=1590651 RepID=A0ABR5ABN2_9BACL|nr:hypothetical protein [Paenibacillus sp. VKM B-2647]KIL38302.1 hypothetical protein SD70_27185 [Paenibacillus sp. VKM B-2647]